MPPEIRNFCATSSRYEATSIFTVKSITSETIERKRDITGENMEKILVSKNGKKFRKVVTDVIEFVVKIRMEVIDLKRYKNSEFQATRPIDCKFV